MSEREFVTKIRSGEYITKWNGFSPFYIGCLYGDSVKLGGEDKFKQCYDLFTGIGDVDWWIVEEINKLSPEDQEELLSILKRNKAFHDFKSLIANDLANLLNVTSQQVHRMPNLELYNFINALRSK